MAEIIIIAIFLIPEILGLAEILHTIKLMLISPRPKGTDVMIIIPDNESFAKQLANAAEQRRWHGKRYAGRIIVLDTNLSEEARAECAALARRLNIEICSGTELLKKLT